MKRLVLFLAVGLLPAADWPRTAPERTDHQATSRVADVADFMKALQAQDAALVPYRPAGAPATAEGGTPLLSWRLPATGKDPVRVYVNANIHAGEVEGKEAIQQIVRELLQGRHPEIRKRIELVVTPAYNADGTDALDPANRRHQPNPASGVGRRENIVGLDLNRDLMKASGRSTRFFLAMMRDFDPAVVLDLHTTNGSCHGFHLTHAPSQAVGADPQLLAFNRRMLKEVSAELRKTGIKTYDYGDFEGGEPARKGGTPTAWSSFDPRPRYLTNYPALHNRLGVLSEAFVYRTFPERIQDTRAFVLGCLAWIAAHPQEVQTQTRHSEEAWLAAWKGGRPTLPLNADPEETERATFEAFVPERNAEGRVVAVKSWHTFDLPAFVTFKAKDFVPAPDGYLVDPAYVEEVRPLLEAHGLTVLPGSKRPRTARVQFFHEGGRTLGTDAYQGVFNLTLRGEWKPEPVAKPRLLPWREEDLDRALWVPLAQPHGRLAFYLLDPRSSDGLVHWGAFHSSLVRGRGMWGEPPRFPILAVGDFADVPVVPQDAGPARKAE